LVDERKREKEKVKVEAKRSKDPKQE